MYTRVYGCNFGGLNGRCYGNYSCGAVYTASGFLLGGLTVVYWISVAVGNSEGLIMERGFCRGQSRMDNFSSFFVEIVCISDSHLYIRRN